MNKPKSPLSLSDKKKKLKAIIENAISRRGHTFADLLYFRDEIVEARKLKFSATSIARFLKEVGIITSATTVRNFCIQNLGESVKERTKTKKNRARQQEATTAQSKEAPNGLRPGFRVPRDDL